MIDPGQLYDFFLQQQVNFYTGVPDSLLKHFIKYVEDKAPADQHIITANEGLALSLATGYYLQTARLPLIYLQNSGLGNLVNPLTSLADKEMYGIPMLLMVGSTGLTAVIQLTPPTLEITIGPNCVVVAVTSLAVALPVGVTLGVTTVQETPL